MAERTMGRRRAARSWALILGLIVLAVQAFGTAAASASFGIAGFDGEAVDQGGNAYTQAGGHPFAASTTIQLNQTTDKGGNQVPDGSVRKIDVDLPAGFVGNPFATPTHCTEDELEAGSLFATAECPPSSQVGTTTVDFQVLGPEQAPVYNMVSPVGVPAQLGFKVASAVVHLTPTVRTGGDYGITEHVDDISQAIPIAATTLTLWGVPADAAHDGERGECLGLTGPTGESCPTDAPREPFLTNPTACPPPGVGLQTTLRVESWRDDADEASFFSHLPPGLPSPGPQQGPTGCDRLRFEPAIAVSPTTRAADSPTGLTFDLRLPQNGNPDGLATAAMKKAVVELPEGMTRSMASRPVGLRRSICMAQPPRTAPRRRSSVRWKSSLRCSTIRCPATFFSRPRATTPLARCSRSTSSSTILRLGSG